MDDVRDDPVVLRLVDFSADGELHSVRRDLRTVGYDHRVENGSAWMRRDAVPEPHEGHILLVSGGGGPAGAAAVDRLRQSAWMCMFSGGDLAAARPFARAATEFMHLPSSLDELAVRLERFVRRLSKQPSAKGLGGLDIVGVSSGLQRCVDGARHAARTRAPVLIEGETGVGKELIAKLVHRLSDRSRRAFVPVNCGCLPADLVENELFGHEAGAFTGATSARGGLVQQADGGTLFLDEIDALGARAQVALLRFLQQGEVRAVGGGMLRTVDARVVAASNLPMRDLLASGSFRQDLYFRLNVVELQLPPLRERREDIPGLAQHFLSCRGAAYERPDLVFAEDALAWMMAQEWPGNVRQLDNVVHRAVVAADGPVIRLWHLAPETPQRRAPPPGTNGEAFASAKARALDAFERGYLTTLMREADGNVTAAAVRAGKERRALGKLLKKHGIAAARFR